MNHSPVCISDEKSNRFFLPMIDQGNDPLSFKNTCNDNYMYNNYFCKWKKPPNYRRLVAVPLLTISPSFSRGAKEIITHYADDANDCGNNKEVMGHPFIHLGADKHMRCLLSLCVRGVWIAAAVIFLGAKRNDLPCGLFEKLILGGELRILLIVDWLVHLAR